MALPRAAFIPPRLPFRHLRTLLPSQCGRASSRVDPARSTHIPTPLIPHNHAWPHPAPKTASIRAHTHPPCRLNPERRSASPASHNSHGQPAADIPHHSLRYVRNTGTVGGVRLSSRRGRIIAGRVARCVVVSFGFVKANEAADEGGIIVCAEV